MAPTLLRCAGRCPPRGLIRLGAARRRIAGPHAPPLCGSQDESHAGTMSLQVNPVSTVRRSSAKNSADCISTKRETVRGNSCDIGPSV